MISRRAAEIGFSPTLAVSDLARRMQADGIDVLDFAAGEPDFPTPEAVKRAGKGAIDADRTRYTANAGVPELRRALARTLAGEYGIDYRPEEILVSCGAKASLYFAFQALLDPGDEVVLPSPYWTSYPEQIRLAGGEPVFVACPEERGFRLSAFDLAAALTGRTKCVVLNSPSNPTGASYGVPELEELAAVCARSGVWIIADEIYSRLRFDGARSASIAWRRSRATPRATPARSRSGPRSRRSRWMPRPSRRGCASSSAAATRSSRASTPSPACAACARRGRSTRFAFGSADHVRISYAVPIERVREGMARIESALAELTVDA
jgi:aspartate aminotransferase